MIDPRPKRQVIDGSVLMARNLAVLQALETDGKVPLEHVQDGDPCRLESGRKYRAEVHDNGRVTFHRAEPKLSKAERKAAKRRRRR